MELLILFIAVLVDMVFGEYPPKYHPTVWLGEGFNYLIDTNLKRNKWFLFLSGTIKVILYFFLIAVFFYFLLNILKIIDIYLYLILSIYLLKSTFSIKHFIGCVKTVHSDLIKKDINLAREDLRNLVSRDRSNLSEEEIIHATIASAGENLNDSVIAPIFYFLLFGVTGAVIYRVINSVDAMIGYRTEKYEYFGKFAARLDDAVNFIPARITALLILISSLFIKKSSSKNALNIMLRDNGNTPSINGGWPMAALAGALRITITKPGYYSIGDNIDTAIPEKILLANRFIVLSTAFFLIICFLHLQYGLN